ncbi:MAG: oligosaccharide flippase family protein [Bacteroidales bacterium]|nr:oligosaccharide flippase family protein [Bacteroidales bacterium]
MKKKFLSNLILLLFLNLLVKPFWILGIDRSVQNIVGAEDYGFYYVLFNFSFLFNILLDFGITNYNNRNIAQHSQLLNKHFSGIVIIKLLLAVLYTIITFSVGLIIGFSANQLGLLGFMCFNQFLLSFILYLRSNVSGLLMFRTDSFLSVLDRVLMILICGVLIWGHVTTSLFRIEWFVYAQTTAYLLTAIVASIVVIKKAEFRRLNWNWPFFVMIIRKSFPFAILVLLMTFYNRIDSVMIERLLPADIGEYEVGIYASAYRLLDASNMIAYLFSVLLLPLFSRMIKNRENVVQVVKLAATLLFIISSTVAIGSHFYSFELMNLMYHDHVEESAEVFRLLMFGYIAISTTYVFGTLLTANGSLKTLNIVAASGMFLNFAINMILVPRLYAVGSAYASLIAQYATAFIQLLIACRLFGFKPNYRFLSTLATFAVGIVLINVFSKQIFGNWIYNFMLMVGASVALATLLKLLNIKGFIDILRSKEELDANFEEG